VSVVHELEQRPAPQLPTHVLEAAADAADVDEEMLGRAVELALAGGPDDLVQGWWLEAA
jgi:hypothetical protein